jgi:4-amino-4-deoxy-L-arabinose transferase-like glycosyltransferase
MKKMRTLISKHWRVVMAYLLAIVISASLLLFHLASRPAKLSFAEVNNLRQAASWRAIGGNPLNLPLHLLERLVFYIAPHNVMLLRLPSAILGIVIICLLVGVVRHWYGSKAAVVASLLLSTSSIFLADARQATPEILMFGLILLLAVRSWLLHSKRKLLPLVAVTVALAAGLYIPGFICFIVAGLIWQFRLIKRRLKLIKLWQRLSLLAASILFVLPLLWSVILKPALLYGVFGLPSHFDFSTMLQNLYHIPLNIFIRSSLSPAQLIPHLPILNIFEIVILILGVYSLWFFRKSERFISLYGLCALAIILLTIGGPVSVNLLVPIIYIVITVGVFYMLENWLYVFPINPIARTIGTIIIVGAVGISCWYHVSSYYVAWQHNLAAQAVFSQSANNI